MSEKKTSLIYSEYADDVYNSLFMFFGLVSFEVRAFFTDFTLKLLNSMLLVKNPDSYTRMKIYKHFNGNSFHDGSIIPLSDTLVAPSLAN